MRVEIITFGKTKEPGFAEAERNYLKRLKSDLKIEVCEVKTGSEEAVLSARLKGAGKIVVLDEAGKLFTSLQFAERLKEYMLKGVGVLHYAIGGPYGLPEAAKQMADEVLSLSPLTFPAHVARFLLVEQLYRAVTILKGHPYHKG